ncbi:MAG TPA: DoxX family protein [Chitinophagaceae bacterium]|nr:DoxX family protein [Chitinophagaceae bacterium]
MKKFLSTNNSAAITVIRVILGIILFAHGSQKLLGWFGGYGFSGTMGFLTGAVHLPYILALFVIIIEFFGSLLLITGFATRFAAAAVIILFTGIILTSHIQNGFFMNWGGDQKGEGYEYHLLVLSIAVALLINGGGRFSADKAIAD